MKQAVLILSSAIFAIIFSACSNTLKNLNTQNHKSIQTLDKKQTFSPKAQQYLDKFNQHYNKDDYTKALEFALKACDLGAGEACFTAGNMYGLGEGVPKDATKAIRFWGKACKLEYGDACYNAGISLQKGRTSCAEREEIFEIDVVKSAKYFQKGCDLNQGTACAELGNAYWNGSLGVEMDDAKSAILWQKSCDLDSGLGCLHLGYTYYKGDGGVKSDNNKAIKAWEKSCELDNVEACWLVANEYQLGKMIKQDLQKAEQAYNKMCHLRGDFDEEYRDDACKRGKSLKLARLEEQCSKNDAQSCFELAEHYTELYIEDEGYDEEDLDRAKRAKHNMTMTRKFWQKACDLGKAKACFNLGVIAENGNKTRENAIKSNALFNRVCKLDAQECYEIGDSFLFGRNTLAKNSIKAIEFLIKACDAKHSEACQKVANMYYDSLYSGMKQDKPKAMQYFIKSCDLGLAASCYQAAQLEFTNCAKYQCDKTKILELIAKTCNIGGGHCDHLAEAYRYGRGLASQDTKKALDFYEKGCKSGDNRLCFAFAKWYENGGEGLSQNKQKAREIYEKLCEESNYKESCTLAKSVAK